LNCDHWKVYTWAAAAIRYGLRRVAAASAAGNRQQLTSEIEGLQLLLEGALSDRFVKNQRTIKPRTTVGFPISLTPQPRYRNAVAVVEVEVETAHPSVANEPPAITALLPREKTYNVAAMTHVAVCPEQRLART
jgi:hypothetical protein